jgi:prophage regulatory protein
MCVNNFLRFQKVMDVMAMSRSTLHLRVKQGLLTPPVRLGERCTVWPEHEISAINAARIAQKSNDEIRELVAQLQQKRATIV